MKNSATILSNQSVKGNPVCFFCQYLFEKISIGAMHSLDAGLSRLFPSSKASADRSPFVLPLG